MKTEITAIIFTDFDDRCMGLGNEIDYIERENAKILQEMQDLGEMVQDFQTMAWRQNISAAKLLSA